MKHFGISAIRIKLLDIKLQKEIINNHLMFLGGVWQCVFKMAESLPDSSSPTEDKENADPNVQDPKKGKNKKDKDVKSKDSNSTENKEGTDKDNEGGEMKDDPEIPTKETISLMVYCEKGVAGPFDMEVNEEHPFSLGATEVFDDVVRKHSIEFMYKFLQTVVRNNWISYFRCSHSFQHRK